jgi:hypothetical protein
MGDVMGTATEHETKLAEAREYAEDFTGTVCEKCYAVMLPTGIDGAFWHDCDGAPTHKVL